MNKLMFRFRRLSPFQKLAVAAALFIAVIIGLQNYHEAKDRANASANFSYNVCLDTNTVHHNEAKDCDLERKGSYALYISGSLGNSIVTAIASLIFIWIIEFILYYVWRIQVAGFQTAIQWKNSDKFKRTIIVACFIFSGIVLLFCLMSYLNLITDYQVPVTLGSGVNVFSYGDNYVSAEGTWTFPDKDGDDGIATPLQKSKIECYKELGYCEEAKAYIFDHLLAVDTTRYNIISWTPSAVLFRNDLSCASETFTIDLVAKTVTGAGHLVNQESEQCRLTGGIDKKYQQQNWQYRMADGFKVYWSEKQKARPYLLRLIQAVSGN